jgi:hypothetical protein
MSAVESTIKQMRKFLFLFGIACSCQQERSFEGAYELIAAKYGDSTVDEEDIKTNKTVRVAKNGYWITSASADSRQLSFKHTSGGTYFIKNRKCVENMHFGFRENLHSTILSEMESGQQFYVRNRIVKDARLGKIVVKEKFKKLPNKYLSDTTVEGVWKIITSKWFGHNNKEKDFAHIKIYCYPYFIWANYGSLTREVTAVGGGTYQFNGTELIEYYNSFYPSTPAIGVANIKITWLSSGEMLQVHSGGIGKEMFKKIK